MKKPTILVVDDELFFRRLYTELLDEEGYTVETVETGDSALTRLRQGGVDVVLTDMVMPGISGLDVLRLARDISNPPEVILATSHATLDTAIQALKNGARDYLIKPFDPEELRHLVRTSLEQRRLLDENSLLKGQIRLYQTGQNLASQMDNDKLLPQAVENMLREIGKGRGFAFLHERNKPPRILGPQSPDQEGQMLPMAVALFSGLQDITGLRLIHKEDLSNQPSWPKDLRTLCVFPLRFGKYLCGALYFYNALGADLPTPFPYENLLFLAKQTSLGFHNSCRFQGTKDLVYLDDLTGLHNYRYLQVVLNQEIRRAERYGLELSLIFMDIDFFKNVNDTHGHPVGSQVLIEVAELLRICVREVDVVFRYGGDEFTAVLIETGNHGCTLVSERIRQTIESHTFLKDTPDPVRLTITVGHAAYPSNAVSKQALINLADQAMYKGKLTRNVSRSAWDIE
jgi:diguanylate cyclase (GGDEF)-like protein